MCGFFGDLWSVKNVEDFFVGVYVSYFLIFLIVLVVMMIVLVFISDIGFRFWMLCIFM